jgi:hypothetical protein
MPVLLQVGEIGRGLKGSAVELSWGEDWDERLKLSGSICL